MQTRMAETERGGKGTQVQRTGDARDTTAATHAAAAQGVGKATGVLPHLARIQRAFGRHDVTDIRVEVGGAAAEAAGAIGAEAYAAGNRIAFAAPPDLHTAAHEAAHVVQQRAGITVPGGVGTAGDGHERHADRVADAVVAGRSAEAILDEVAPGAAARTIATPAVQRKEAEEPKPVKVPAGKYVTAPRYVKGHAREIAAVIHAHLTSAAIGPGHPRLAWHDLDKFNAELWKQLDRLLGRFADPEAFRSVLIPNDPYELIDEMRPIAGYEKPIGTDPLYGGKAGLITYRPSIALAVAQLFEGAIVRSLGRIAPRWLAEADLAAGGPGRAHGKGLSITTTNLAMSHHMDRAVVPALLVPGVLDVRAATKDEAKQRADDAAHGRAAPTAPPPGRRKLEVEWQGPKNRLMWNWLRVKSPADATAEEVAAHVFEFAASNYGETNGSFLAYGLTAAPPFFALPGTWARRIPEMNAFAPAAADKDTTAHEHNLVLASAPVTDELALIEAGRHPKEPADKGKAAPPAPTLADVGTLIDDISIQANLVKARLAPWKLTAPVDKTLQFLGRKLAELHAPADLARWAPVLEHQKGVMATIGSAVIALDNAATGIGLKDKSGADAGPLREIMMVYADAAASSHLADTSARLLAQAGTMQSRLSLRAVEATTRAMASSVDAMNDATHGPQQRDYNKAGVELQQEGRSLQSRMLRGEQVSDKEVEDFTLSANIVSLRAKAEAAMATLRNLKQAAHAARDGFAKELAAWFSGDFRELEHATGMIEADIYWTIQAMDFDVSAETMSIRDPDEYSVARHKAYQRGFTKANEKFEAIRNHTVGNKSLKVWLEDGVKLIEHQELRTAIIKMAALLGISLIGGALGGMVTRWVAGVWGRFASAGLAEISLGGKMVAGVAGMTVDSAIGAAGQSMIFGDHYGGSFLEHMMTALGSAGLLKGLHALTETADKAAAVERGLASATKSRWLKGGKLVIKEGAAVTGHAIMGAALGYVAHKIVTGQSQPPPSTVHEWLMQGASVAIGRYAGEAIQHRIAGHKKLAAIPEFEPGKQLLAESLDLQRMAANLEAHPQASTAMEVLAKRHRVLLDEVEALDRLKTSKPALKKSGLTPRGIETMKAELHAQLAESHAQGFEDLSLHLAGLEELVPGAAWKGTRENIELAVRSAERSGAVVEASRDAATGRWKVSLNGRQMEIHEAGGGKAPAGPTPPGGGKPVEADPAHADRALVTQAVPGSEFRGLDKPLGRAQVQNQHGFVLQQEAHYKILGLVDLVPGLRSIQRSAAGPYVVTLTDGTAFGIDVTVAPLDGQTVARAIVNPTKPGRIKVYGGELDVQGRHVIQLSTSMNQAQVERAVAGQLGVIATAHHEMVRGRHDGPNALGTGSASKLGPLDVGRAAEINTLARQIAEHPADARALRRELVALVEHLGVRSGADGGDARWHLLEPTLTRQARDEMGRARRNEGDLGVDERTQLGKVREEAFDDLKGMMKPGTGNQIARPAAGARAPRPEGRPREADRGGADGRQLPRDGERGNAGQVPRPRAQPAGGPALRPGRRPPGRWRGRARRAAQVCAAGRSARAVAGRCRHRDRADRAADPHAARDRHR